MLTLDVLGRHGAIRHGFLTRRGGVSGGLYASLNCGFGSGDDRDRVARNRQIAMQRMGLAEDALMTVYQVHGAEILVVDRDTPKSDPPEADAMVSREPGVALGILTADCAPVLFADPDVGVIGAAHAGWRGARTGVLEATVAAMADLGARRESIVAAIGPCIARTSYEVGPEFPGPFIADDPANRRFFTAAGRPGHHRFDLSGYVAARLAALGLAAVEAVSADTCADGDRFFSYRRTTLSRESDYGRGLSAIALED